MPGIYFVFREGNQSGFPFMNPWSETMMNHWYEASSDYNLVATSNLGRFLRYLKLVIEKYISRIDDSFSPSPPPPPPPSSGASKPRTRSFVKPQPSHPAVTPSIGDIIKAEARAQALWSPPEESKATAAASDTSKETNQNAAYEYPSRANHCSDSIADITLSINTSITEFYARRGISELTPFLLVFDELSLLTRADHANAFRIIRRALSCFDASTNIFALALGTNTDILEFHPGVSDSSSREVSRTEQIRPFIPIYNYDVLWGYVDPSDADKQRYHLNKIVVDERLLLNRRHSRLLASLGRPLWSSVPLNRILDLSKEKLINGHRNSGEPYLAMWALRAGIYIVPTHKIARLMVKSLMATCFFTSEDGSDLWLGYPSDPVLACAASRLTATSLQKEALFLYLEKFFDSGAVDTGRLGESVASMLLLLAMDNCNTQPPLYLTNNDNIDGLHDLNDLSRRTIFAETEPKTNLPPMLDGCLDDLMNVQTVRSFLTTLYGADVVSKLESQAGHMKGVLDSLMNMSHFIPLSRQWCQEDSKNLHSLPKSTEKTSIPPVIDDELLSIGLMRNAGFLMPPNYYGIDSIIPTYTIETDTRGYIGVQIKTENKPFSKNAVLELIAKMFPGDHYVICLTCKTPNEECPSCVAGKKWQANISKSVLVLIVTIGSEMGSRDGPEFDEGEYLDKAKGVYMCQAEHEVNGVKNNAVGISSFGTSFMSFLPEKARASIVNMFAGRNIFNTLSSNDDRMHVTNAMRQMPAQYPEAYEELYRRRQDRAAALQQAQMTMGGGGQEGASGSKRAGGNSQGSEKKRSKHKSK